MKRTLLRNIFNDDIKINDKKFKFIEERVHIVEQNIPNLKSKLADYVDKKSAEKKCMEKVILVLRNISDVECVSASAKYNVDNFSKVLKEISDQDELLVNCIKSGVIDDLAGMGKRCKHIRSDLKTAADRELILQRQVQRLEMLKQQEYDRLSTGEADVIKARKESGKAAQTLEEHADLFELNKLQTLKAALLNWTTMELRYHARCLELFTSAYRAAAEIDVSSDHEEFRSKLNGFPSTRLSLGQNSSMEIGSTLNASNPIGRRSF